MQHRYVFKIYIDRYMTYIGEFDTNFVFHVFNKLSATYDYLLHTYTDI